MTDKEKTIDLCTEYYMLAQFATPEEFRAKADEISRSIPARYRAFFVKFQMMIALNLGVSADELISKLEPLVK